MDQNESKWTEWTTLDRKDQHGWKWTAPSGLGWTEVNQNGLNGSKWTEMDQTWSNGLKRTEIDQNATLMWLNKSVTIINTNTSTFKYYI